MSSDDSEVVEALVTGGARPSAYRELLRNRGYRVWFLSSLASCLGDWTGLFALQVLVASLAEPGSRTALFGLGGIMMARLLPSLLMGPVAGVLADRYDRKTLMVFTGVARGLLFVGVAFSRDLVGLFALTFVVECLSLLYIAAKDASLPVIVPRAQLTEANQLNLLVTYGPLPVAALFATGMAVIAGALGVDATTLALLVNAAMFLLGAAIIAHLALPPHGRRRSAHDEGTSIIAELKEGIRFIADLPLVRALIVGVVGVCFSAGVVVTLGPEFVRTGLGQPGTAWFTLMTFVGLGLVAGILVVPPIVRRIAKARVFPVVLGLTGAIATVMAAVPDFTVTLVLGFLLGTTAGMSFVTGYTLLHENTHDGVRARTFAAFYTGTRVAMFAALGLAPFLAGAIGRGTLIIGGRVVSMSGVRLTILAAGLLAVASAVATGRRMYRALRDDERTLRLPAPPGRPARGVFIAFEGVEGSGKSTQIHALAETLRAEGYDVVVTREPGGPPVSERIRDVLLDASAEMGPRTEALLYAAARAEHVDRVIAPALAEGRVVLCDRFLDSSLAYQGFARAVGEPDIAEINRWATGGVVPDAVVLLALDPREGLRRARERAGAAAPDRIEAEALDFHERVRDGYQRLAERDPDRFVVIAGDDAPEAIAREVRLALARWLPLPEPTPVPAPPAADTVRIGRGDSDDRERAR